MIEKELKKEAEKTDTKKQYIKIRGANEHNLKNVDLNIPRNELVVLTGLSGSGKIVPSIRYNLCGRTEKIYGIVIVLRKTIFRTDGEAGCGEY